MGDPRTINLLKDLADNLYQQGKFAKADPLYRELVEKRRELNGNRDPETIDALEFYELTKQKLSEEFLILKEKLESFKGTESKAFKKWFWKMQALETEEAKEYLAQKESERCSEEL